MKKLNLKLTFAGLFVLLVGLWAVLFLFQDTVTKTIQAHEERERDAFVNATLSHVKRHMLRRHPEAINGILDDMVDGTLIQGLFVFSPEGSVFSKAGEVGPFFRADKGPCSECHRKGPPLYIRQVNAERACLTCHKAGGGPMGYIGLLRADELHTEVLAKLEAQSLWVMALGGLFFGVAGFVFIWAIVIKRLRVLRQRIKEFSPSYWVPIEHLGSDEIGDIARAFNEMAERVSSTERALRESKEFLSSVLRGMKEMVMVVDASYRITYVNEAFLKYKGLKWDEAVGRPCYEVLHGFGVPCYEVSLSESQCYVREALEGKSITGIRRHTTDKGNRYFLVKYSPIELHDRKEVLEVATEITEQVLSERRNALLRVLSQTLQRAGRTEEFLEEVLTVFRDAFGGLWAGFYELQDGTLTLRTSLDGEISAKVLEDEVFYMGSPLIWTAIGDVPSDAIKVALKTYGAEAAVAVPLKSQDRQKGLFLFLFDLDQVSDFMDRMFWSIVTDVLNSAYHRCLVQDELISKIHFERAMLSVLERLAEEMSLEAVIRILQ
ncbi:MAG: HAMP domain-containing protein, partial [Nitrospirae bacterium]